MGLFDIFKTKKTGPELYWKQMDLIEGADVGFYIKRILADNSKSKGYIYIHEEPYEFAYGNMSDIVPNSIMHDPVSELWGTEENGIIYFKLV